MKDDSEAKEKALERMVKRTKGMLDEFRFEPNLSLLNASTLRTKRIFSHSPGNWICEESRYNRYIDQWADRFDNFAISTIEICCRRMLNGIFDEFALNSQVNWEQSFAIAT